jgi:hypothetical protein
LDVYARHTSSRITCLTLTIVGLNNNLVNAWMATEAMQIASLTFHSDGISDWRATMILSANWRSP